MELIINWVSQIIIFILLATIIDLVVPAGSMKKYVKFVIGLILILIFLQPIFHLLNFDIEQAVKTTFDEVLNDNSQTKDVENLIEFQKSEIESSANAYILEQLAVQMEDLVKAPLLDNYQAEIQNIDFQFKEGTAYSYEELEEVKVYLRESEAGEGAVNAVNDVVIDTREENPSSKAKDVDVQGMETLLRQIWELSDKKLTVIWEGGAS
ncbi:stage III sporulation protein AF [Ornithinibacillus bavariensis]|uniref:Stage III sporulation protein AF n=1 Tax=Ornithinibacillus bavariensis TaxID=545502 RepID=A0A920C9I4_9BACI|nr:stage III sporulation protein AF [Ornithinibacillus bavariensis]GIO28557.1 stage III sporulation protein AF [Ornithinibacillus bavariensis]